ncbi:MAG: putative essential recombination function protein [Prokaryotic dsDNA virus sp.]|nr:MAG: putative essential recombination function protein [Prokaryotic dsDNA virus sp.]
MQNYKKINYLYNELTGGATSITHIIKTSNMSKTTDKVIALKQQEAMPQNNSKQLSNFLTLKAIADFQQECPVIHKGTKGYGYSYADLTSIFRVIMPLMKKHHLGFMQPIEGTNLKTIIFYTKKEAAPVVSISEIPQDVQLKGMNIFQVYGSAITYFRRYALSSALGIITDKDIDASGEQENTKTYKKKKPTLDSKRFKVCLEKVQSGIVSVSEVKKHYELNEDQIKTLSLC